MKKVRSLGIWMLASLVVGNMVGSGIFLLPASLAAYGSITLVSWAVTAVGAIFLSLVFADLSRRYPVAGGPYVYCKKGLGDFVAFLVAYNYWIYLWVGNAAVAVAFTGYCSPFFPRLTSDPFLAFCVTAGIVWLFTLINIVNVRLVGIIQLVLTVLKLVPLLAISFIGIFFIKKAHLFEVNVSGVSNWNAIISGSMLTLWAFLGLESGSIPADNVQNPEKAIPRATVLGTVAVAVIYIVSTVAIFGIIPPAKLAHSPAPFVDMAVALFGDFGRYFMGIGAAVACAGAINGWILIQGQIPMAAARDRLFPKFFIKTSVEGIPVRSLLVSSTLITVLLFFNFHRSLVHQFTFIVLLATLAALITYLFTTLSYIIVSIRNKEKLPFPAFLRSSSITVLAFLYSYLALIGSGKTIVFYGILLLFSSFPVYAWLFWQKHKVLKAEHETHL